MPVPVDIQGMSGVPRIMGAPFSADFVWQLAMEGRLYVASGTAQNSTVTGQTSFANTTPTFLVDVPAGTVLLPMFLNLSQTGSVAGGAIDVYIEMDQTKKRLSATVGTQVAATNVGLRAGRSQAAQLYTGATALAGYGVAPWHATIGQDVSPAEGAVQGPFWRPEVPYFLAGPGAWLIYTWAGSTGPTWFYALGWAEWNASELKGTGGLLS